MAAISVDYTNRDEVSIKAEQVRRKPFLTPEWTDDNDSDLGMVLLDEMKVPLSVLHYYLDRAAGEGFVETAKKRESLTKLFWFWNIPGKTPATVTLKFSIDVSQKADVIIPAKTQVQTISNTSPVFFETDIALTLKYTLLTSDTSGITIIYCNTAGFVAGQLVEIGDNNTSPIQRTIQSVGGASLTLDSVVPSGFTTGQSAYVSALNGEVTATEGKSITETAVNSDGSEFQTRRSINIEIIDGSLKMVINEGSGDEDWLAQITFYESISTDKHFIWKRKWDETIQITFGDGAQGKIPVAGATIVWDFRQGGGARGNVGENTITQINNQILVLGIPINIEVTNEEAASGGADRMDNEEAKIRGPEIIRANDRYVSQRDFIAGAKSVSGVGQANAVRVTEPGVDYNVAIYIIPSGGGLPSTALKAAVKAEIESKCTIRAIPEVFDPKLVRIDLGGTVNLFSNYLRDIVSAAVDEALIDFFTVNNQEFGKSVRLSDVSRVIDEIEGVDYVDITKLTIKVLGGDVVLSRWTGDPSFSDVIIGSTAISEIWTIVFTSTTNYSVRGSVSGVQIATGTLDSLYTSDNAEVKFTILSGGTAPAIGDTAYFRVSKYLGNIDILEDEIPILYATSLVYSGGG
jgi:hypothetical protein